MQWGDFENSLKYLNEALDYALSSNSLMGQFLLYDDIANIYKLTEKFDSSLKYYEKTLDIAENIKNTYAIIVSNLNVAFLKYEINPSYDIIPILEELQSEAKDNNFVRLYIDIGFTLCEVLQDKGNYREANVLYQEIFALRDSVIGNEEIRQVAEIEYNYEIEKKELENRELMSLNEINSLKLRARKTVIFFTVFILIQALVLLLIIFRKYKTIKQNLATIKEQEKKIYDQEKELLQKEKEAVELQLECKEREHTSLAAKVFQYNQLNQKVIDELASIKKILITDCNRKEVNSKIQSLINEMGSSLSNHIWKEFETIFTESNPDYLKKLTTQFPNLTTNEIKLCVLLYINLRTKEIAAITKQSIKSINVARTRLRKKLHLKHTNANISSFLQQIS
jgi:tetratricopeptide (TPR) repeat protein/DNA-binding CsgD family transcriptional regulator